ncbi:T9SS type A sorting domain-containing protein [Flavobacterium microcysteis]|uniref:T9SS type A sorting domain-containing protein n=1 Tax=Flavobacterium microcysteis TaxID=2596891 RepID=A0A501Q049_9FLAO|nr:T9SS type A sorting domain-containing protein [Flavobacterium microcysteis]TPD65386.1 T9SS type A sorting domain-containing protein [Flavobacterium microcysteis]
MKHLLLCFILFWHISSKANDECVNAIQLTPNANCNVSGTFSGATLSGTTPSCANNSSQDVWYKFTATEQTMAVNLSRVVTNTTMYLAMEIYEDSCTGNRFKCIAPSTDVSVYYNTDFVIGRTYYVRVLNPIPELSARSFYICIQAFPKPANDSCATAEQLTPNTNCTNTFGSFSGSLLDGPVPSCATGSRQDVWYKFTATEQTMAINLSRAVTNTTMYFAMEIYEESCSGNRFKCISQSADVGVYFGADFVIGRTYYVRVMNPAGDLSTRGFNICIQSFPKPANDTCATAAVLTPNSGCVNTAGTFRGAVLDGGVPSCAANSSQDVWYRFTATEQTMSISLSRIDTSWSMNFAMEIYEESCSGNLFKCVAPNQNAATYFNSDFTVGRTYYVRVLNPDRGIITLPFNICLRAYPKPANDTCATAVVLTPNSSCVNTAGTFSGALLDGGVPSCAANSSQDVWYRFTATEQTMSIFVSRVDTSWFINFAMEIYEEGCNGNLFKCVAPNQNAATYFNSNFTVGRTYYVRLLNPDRGIITLPFNICLQAFPKPVNDTCATATVLTPTSGCVNTAGTFSGALLDGGVPSCAANSSQDVWYRFTATEQTMSVYLSRIDTGWSMNFAMEIYEESCSGNLFKCVAPNQNAATYFNSDFTVGRTYYVRVLNPDRGIITLGFNICLQAFPKPVNDTCATATVLTPNSSCVSTVGTFSGALLDGGVASCAANSSQDVWYRFTATEQTMSVYVVRIDAGWTMNFAMEIYEESCSGNRFKCISTNQNASTYFNSDFTVGRTYYVRVLNPDRGIITLPFNICLQAFPKPANDTCATAIELTPANTCVNTSGTFRGALLDGGVPSCAANSSQDVWYRFTATGQSMSVSVIRVDSGWSMNLAMEIYEDSCTGNRLQCVPSNSNASVYSGNSFVIGRTYYVRVLNPNAAINALPFTICLVGPPPAACTPTVTIAASEITICQGTSVAFTATPVNGGTAPSYQWKVNGNNVGINSPTYTTTTLANGSVVTCTMLSNAACASPTSVTSNAITMNVTAPTVPSFTQIAPVCSGGTFTLPTVSNNGIGGVWSPVINNTATTTYTFTPSTGQCVTTATMTVVVNLVNKTTTLQGSTITASATGATYQWINCANNQPIDGATNASYTASANGSYAVIVTQNGCSATSNCVQITNLGVDTFVKGGLKIYPNPTADQLFVQLNDATEITIVDMTGKTIQRETLKSGNNSIDVSSLASGMYFIRSVSGATAKFVKK